MTSDPRKRLTAPLMAGYGAAEIGSSMAYTLFFTYCLIFLTDVVKLSPAVAGTVFAIGIFWDALVDPAVGIWSDNLSSRHGRRRPFVLCAALPLALITWAFFTDFGFPPLIAKIYFTVMAMLYFTAYSLLETPHLALAAEMTQDYDKRNSILSWRMGWGQLGALLAGPVVMVLVGHFKKSGLSPETAWSISAGSLIVFCVPLILLSWRVTRGHELFVETNRLGIKEMLSDTFHNRTFQYVMVFYSLSQVAIVITGGAGMYFMTYAVKMSDNQIAVALLIIYGGALLWLPVVSLLTTRLGKRRAWFVVAGIWALVQGVGFQWVITSGQVFLVYAALIFIGCGLTGTCMIGWSVISDCIEVDELVTGQRREGAYFGVISFVQKCCSALAMFLIGQILNWIGYLPNAAQKPQVLLALRTISGGGVLIILSASILFCYLMPMTRKRHKALCRAIAAKKTGEPYDQTAFRDLAGR